MELSFDEYFHPSEAQWVLCVPIKASHETSQNVHFAKTQNLDRKVGRRDKIDTVCHALVIIYKNDILSLFGLTPRAARGLEVSDFAGARA